MKSCYTSHIPQIPKYRNHFLLKHGTERPLVLQNVFAKTRYHKFPMFRENFPCRPDRREFKTKLPSPPAGSKTLVLGKKSVKLNICAVCPVPYNGETTICITHLGCINVFGSNNISPNIFRSPNLTFENFLQNF